MNMSQKEILKNGLIIWEETNLVMKKLLAQFMRKVWMPKWRIHLVKKVQLPAFDMDHFGLPGTSITLYRTATRSSSNRLAQDPKFTDLYIKFMDDYIAAAQGQMVPVTDSTFAKCFIQVIFDASA